MRSLARFALLSVVALGCSDPAVPLSGQAVWADDCPMNACPSAPHAVRGSQGSPRVDVDCSISPAVGGSNIFFRIAALAPTQENFDDSSEGLLVRGFVPGAGMELRAGVDTPGYVNVRGGGWYSNSNTIGPATTSTCHVFIDRFTGGGFAGRISCNGMRDDATPPHERRVHGSVGTRTPEFGEFVFNNCASN